MTKWVVKGLRTGIKSTHYPDSPERAAGVSPGRPAGTRFASDRSAAGLVERCPTDALEADRNGVSVLHGRCVHCFRCARVDAPTVVRWEQDYEWAAIGRQVEDAQRRLGRAFGRSLYIRFLDAGACGACMSEAGQLNNPYYNIHRLGFFMTPTPRNADILLVAGPLTDAMRLPLQKTYDAMPTPKRVVAIGACALSGGVFGPSFASAGGVGEFLPVDVVVPGCPPPPLAILHGLLVAVERKPPAPLRSAAPDVE
jgi:Ni,Fe-hydrogenase III small subunit